MGELPWLGDEHSYQARETDRFLLAIGDVDSKRRVVASLKGAGAMFMTLIHDTALVSSCARVGEGVVICPFVIISDQVVVGDFVTMNYYSSCGHDSRVGDYSALSPYAALGGGATLEEGGFMGISASIAPKVKVGRDSKVAANSVVLRDAPAHSLTLGVPGRSIRFTRRRFSSGSNPPLSP
jgi:sugar O-acyltransferase (sialic acid O-acetyltransferase NeuD family)